MALVCREKDVFSFLKYVNTMAGDSSFFLVALTFYDIELDANEVELHERADY